MSAQSSTSGGEAATAAASSSTTTSTATIASSKNAHEALFAVFRSRNATSRALQTAAQTYLSSERKKKKKKSKKAKNSIFFFCTGVASSPADEVARALVTACTTSRTVTAQHAAAHAICAASTVVRVAALRLLAGASKASLAPRQARALVVALAAALRCGFDGVDAIGNVVSDAVAALQALVPPLAARAVHTALHVGAVSRHGQAAWRLVVRQVDCGNGNDTVLGALLACAEIRLAVMRPAGTVAPTTCCSCAASSGSCL
jgi:hypothetical protein